ncbi:MAG: glycosyltransferase [Patescibacteria group bacterium]|nr:glycosyltransferase [Patescibacteria group bacterium]
MKIALVHDMLTQFGGAEKVLKALTDIYPKAPIFTLIYNEKKFGGIFPRNKVRSSFLQNFPYAKTKFELYLPLMPLAAENFDLSEFDLVISSSSSFANGVIIKPPTKHICYCHTPTRYLWIDSKNYINNLKYNKFIKTILPLILNRLKIWDKSAADKTDNFIANSENVKERIKKHYNRDSAVIYPPVETEKFFVSQNKNDYFLIGGRLVSYKKFDLAIEAFNKLKIPLKIFGEGPDYKKLKKIADKNIQFLGFVSEREKAELYSKARAFIYPHEEDFGITVIEAIASGTPIIAYKAGGALESIIEGVNGEFFTEQNWKTLADKISNFDSNNYNPIEIKKLAKKFNENAFKRKIKEFVGKNTKSLIL